LVGHVVDDPFVEQRDRQTGIVEIWIVATADLGKEDAVQPAFRYIERGRSVSGARWRHHHVATPREPHGCVPELDKREESALLRVQGNAMVHHDKRERASPDRANHIGSVGSVTGSAQTSSWMGRGFASSAARQTVNVAVTTHAGNRR
jgi:hypothetical protein